MRRALALAATLFALPAPPAPAQSPAKPHLAAVDARIAAESPDLVKLYTHLHENPELSLFEEQSAARMVKELTAAGFTVTTKFGGHGVVGVLANGPGPTVMIRADMDALPVTEQTGVAYASKVRTRDRSGNETGVMHACGHDVHMTCFVGTARVLASMKGRWSGTLMFVAQPAEEVGMGAKAMLDAGLFTKFKKPDYAVALHCEARLPVGQIAYSEGLALANVDTVDVTVKGKGGHGAAPHTTVDPIVLAAKIILDLQTIASREVNPTDPVVVTVGSIHGGTKHNIIPNEVKLQITVRSTKDGVRDQVLKAIDRKCKAAALGADAPEPVVSVRLDEYTPATVNDVKLTRRLTAAFRDFLGDANVIERAPILGGEDFGRFGREGIPICMYFLGTIAPEKFAAAQRPGAATLPSMHADSYAPLPGPSVAVGVKTLSVAVLDLLAVPVATKQPPAADGDLGAAVLKFVKAKVGEKVGDGECATLVARALEAAGAKTTADFGVTGDDGDYVWGTPVEKPADAKPGDVIQYRDAVFVTKTTTKLPGGGTQTRTATRTVAHHTSVVAANLGGKLTVYEQNVGTADATDAARKVVQENALDLADKTEGKVWVYRPVKK